MPRNFQSLEIDETEEQALSALKFASILGFKCAQSEINYWFKARARMESGESTTFELFLRGVNAGVECSVVLGISTSFNILAFIPCFT